MYCFYCASVTNLISIKLNTHQLKQMPLLYISCVQSYGTKYFQKYTDCKLEIFLKLCHDNNPLVCYLPC